MPGNRSRTSSLLPVVGWDAVYNPIRMTALDTRSACPPTQGPTWSGIVREDGPLAPVRVRRWPSPPVLT